MRALATAAALALIVTHWSERDAWFVLGVVALVLNVAGIAGKLLGPRLVESGPAAYHDRPGGQDDEAAEVHDQLLSDLAELPAVAAALAEAPEVWRQVSYLDDELDACAFGELIEFVWIETSPDREWAIAFGDEVKPYVDLDVDDPDPLLEVLLAHPLVSDAWHEDREVYRAVVEPAMTVEEFAALGTRALIAHHLDAVRRLDGLEQR